MIKTFRDLKIWQQSMELVTAIYKVTSKFPEEEKYGLTSQLRRSSVSIPSNISEGFGRNSQGDFKRFVNISMGSLFELQTQIEVARNLEFLSEEQSNTLYEDSREIERMMSSFIRTLK
jgi:four helix bundle protein